MRPLKILLVDDHDDTLRMLHRLLSSEGHDVRTAVSVRQATEAARDGGRLDVLVSDVGLPDGTAADVLGAVRPLHPHLPAIAVTGHGDDDTVEQSRLAGFGRHLVKPVSFEHLLAAIQEAAQSAGPLAAAG